MVLHLVIRVIHVLFGVFWAGATFFVALYLEPSVRETGQAGGAVMGALTRRGYPKALSIIALLTVLTGLWLLWSVSGHFSGGYMGTPSGILLSSGMLAGLLALGVGVHMVKPVVNKLGAVAGRVAASGAPPSAEDQAEIQRLQGSLRLRVRIAAVLLLVALVTMALGPHV
ncbi:MAG: hypothetical protein PVJ02_19250 [Gemmatimonadota bacterium]|jgi:uncharacterized membrane protein